MVFVFVKVKISEFKEFLKHLLIHLLLAYNAAQRKTLER
jgi:hypothetical protein